MAMRAGIAVFIDGREAKKGSEEFKQAVDSMVKEARQGTTQIGHHFAGLRSELIRFAGELGLTFGAAEVIRRIVETSSEFEKLRIRLQGVTGSAEEAGRAFEFIEKFSSVAPDSVADITQAYIDLVQLGIDPAAGALEAIGNLAVLKNQSIAQATQTVVGAATGRVMQLKDLGIVAEDSGKKVELSFNGARESADKNVASITAAVIKLATSVHGSMERVNDSVGGSFKNVFDAFEKFSDEIGKAGLNDGLKRFARTVEEATRGSDSLAKKLGGEFKEGMDLATKSVIFAEDHFDAILHVLEAMAGAKILGGILNLKTAIGGLKQASDGLAASGFIKWAIANPELAIAILGGLATAAVGSHLLSGKGEVSPLPPGARQIFDTGTPVQSPTHEVPFSAVPTIRDAADQAAKRAAAQKAQADAEAAAEAQKKADADAKQAAETEKKRQQAIADTIRVLEGEATLQERITAATRDTKGLAEAQALGDTDAVDRITQSLRDLQVQHEALRQAESAGIDVTVEANGALTAGLPKDQEKLDGIHARIQATADLAKVEKDLTTFNDAVQAAMVSALTPAEQYQKAIEGLTHAYEKLGHTPLPTTITNDTELQAAIDKLQNPGSMSLADRGFLATEVNSYKGMIEAQRELIRESIKVTDVGKKMFVTLDEEAKNFANDLAQYGVGTIHEFSSSIVDSLSEGKQSFADFATAAIKELARVLVQAELTKAALAALAFFGQRAGTPVPASTPAFSAPTHSVGLPGGGATPPVAYQTTDATSIAMQNQKLAAPSQAWKFDVKVENSPSDKAPQVEMKQTPQGMEMRLVFEAAENFIADRAARGQGSIAPLLKAGGWNPRA